MVSLLIKGLVIITLIGVIVSRLNGATFLIGVIVSLFNNVIPEAALLDDVAVVVVALVLGDAEFPLVHASTDAATISANNASLDKFFMVIVF